MSTQEIPDGNRGSKNEKLDAKGQNPETRAMETRGKDFVQVS